jgi:hypothetical protein
MVDSREVVTRVVPEDIGYRSSGSTAPITAYGLGALGKCTGRARST